MREIRFMPIGIIHSPFKDIKGMPIQTSGAKGVRGSVEIEPEYGDGLKDIEGFAHIILIYHFHLSRGYLLEVKPFLDENLRGVFATRAPKRPNPIGLSVVRLLKVEGGTIQIEDVDIVDGTPLLDIKPYVPEFDIKRAGQIGWLSKRAERADKMRADGRFAGVE
ncbi:tRNA (N6-threonylcarbamoyladenosine(37)-N6)-methyltransferase TrmO [Patescibacteria group bacterium]|nr:tRNA (N6-threonylcarbamoyladenosine(37)-N6)-methyltransferase TrmO [Patescibacteria group bacterium]